MKESSELDSAAEYSFAEPDKEDLNSYSTPPNQSAKNGPNPLLIGIVLVIVFAVGLALGFFGRPQIMADVPVQVVVTVIPNENSQAASQTTNAASNNESSARAAVSTTETITDNSTEASENETSGEGVEAPPTPTIMEFLLADARHFQGDDAAPVTIIEFSDFK